MVPPDGIEALKVTYSRSKGKTRMPAISNFVTNATRYLFFVCRLARSPLYTGDSVAAVSASREIARTTRLFLARFR